MINSKRALAIIPARSGSKGLPNKNVREFCGKPLLAWSIEAALACRYIDSVIVSTDSEDIAAIARSYGADAPFIRPPALAGDGSATIDVLMHALDSLAAGGDDPYDYLVLLEPTSPLREVSDIVGALEALDRDPRIESVVGVALAESTHPSYLFYVEDGLMRPLSGAQPTSLRRQDLKGEVYYLEGSVYVSRVESLRRNASFYHDATAPWVVDRYKAVEVDELSDFIAAEALMQARLSGTLK